MQVGRLYIMALLTTSALNRATLRTRFVADVCSISVGGLPDSSAMTDHSVSLGRLPLLPETRIGNVRTTRTISSTSIGLRPASEINEAAVVSRLVQCGYEPECDSDNPN